jgi:Ser/Thr protein kinase RdoA (MazF antagonist)
MLRNRIDPLSTCFETNNNDHILNKLSEASGLRLPSVGQRGILFNRNYAVEQETICDQQFVSVSVEKYHIQQEMSYFTLNQVDKDLVAKQVSEHWNITLGDLLKASQNQTFAGTYADGSKAIVRVTPKAKKDSVQFEVDLLKYLKSNGMEYVPGTVQTKSGLDFVETDEIIVLVYEHAQGEPIALLEYKWLTDRDQIEALGKWIAQLHNLLRKYNPSSTAGLRNWDQLHNGILKDAPIDPIDIESVKSREAFGVIHGDINISNYFYTAETKLISVFDWDQVQSAWFLYDLAQPIWGVVSCKEGGSFVDGSPVPQANVEVFTDWIVAAYDSVSDVKVDREALQRMVKLRRYLYKEFCTKALNDVDPDSEMGKFMRKVLEWIN